MHTHHHSQVNALTNPVADGDYVIAESGETYQVCQNMVGHFWLRHTDGFDLTHPVDGQLAIVAQIAELANI